MKIPRLAGLVPGLLALCAQAQTAAPTPAVDATPGWQLCGQHTDAATRLACFDRWSQAQEKGAVPDASGSPASAPPASLPAASTTLRAPTASAELPGNGVPSCRTASASQLSRYWELQPESDCGRFNIRSYRPLSLSWVYADTVNTAPSSPTPGHTATEQPYLRSEGRIQLSVRTKIGQGFLPVDRFGSRDSLWFAYTQQSYWQLFTSSISRPFRNTDHEPELIYILPTPADLPGGWKLSYSGVSLAHQSNGQSLPLSRSWNRLIFMTGIEKDGKYTVTGRFWSRITDGDGVDDNPDIDNLIGRGEVAGTWHVNPGHSLKLTLRHSLRADANGSWRFEWLKALGNNQGGPYGSGLRLHVQLFNGYGDSLVDYNYGRSLISIGLSLVDW